jgi:glycogen phosphorylase
MSMKRLAGCCLHLSALPGAGPVGDLDGAEAFVDWLVQSGLGVWQILPSSPCGYGASPYSSWSSFSGNPWFIGFKPLVEAGLLEEYPRWEGRSLGAADYQAADDWKLPLLVQGAQRFLGREHPWRADFEAFRASAHWLEEAGLYWAIKERNARRPWWEWPAGLRARAPEALAQARAELAEDIAVWGALEYFFERQWRALRSLCQERGVRLLGDLPIYVGEDSVAAWSQPELFQVRADGRPSVVAGVPPDPYAAEGQRWGNPIYAWENQTDRCFEWWTQRLRRAFSQTDFVRIDHFLGLANYWAIPADCQDGRVGEWRTGPGASLFEHLSRELGELPLVVEDLGPIDESCRALQQRLGAPGMKVLQFAFGSGPDNEHLPQNLPESCVAYPSTHDSDTLVGWWSTLEPATRAEVQALLPPKEAPIPALMQTLLNSGARWVIVPAQDWLGLGSSARFNIPGTTENNWRWRLVAHQLQPQLSAQINGALGRSKRLPTPQEEPMSTSTTPAPSTVAYFCMEFGLDAALPIYSGGLGVLAGDIMKAACDQDRDFIGIGIFWGEGYTVQTLDANNEPVDSYVPTPRDVLEPTGARATVRIRGADIPITAYRVSAYGSAPLYLLEPLNPEDRWLSKRLYSGDGDQRVAQELLLGVGGVRILRALGLPVHTYHFNEGHALFAGLELVSEAMGRGRSFAEARSEVKAQVVFTTHTPVPAGNEIHPLERLLEQGADLGRFSREQLAAIGGDPFEMTPAALRLSRSANAVARLHGETAQGMWAHVEGRAPIHTITNGVHLPTWQDRSMAIASTDEDIWSRHLALKRELLRLITALNGVKLKEDALLIGFARRAATYKRATLVLRDLEWLEPLIAANRVQIVFSGKAHPRDEGGKDYIREIARMATVYPNNIVFLQNYDMQLGAALTRGCDVWLNTPRRPKEASGTSGMKAASNGILNVSILDGWWAEGCEHGVNGWQLGDGYEGEGADEHDLAALKLVLSEAVLPTYYEDRERWVGMMRAAIETATERFSAARMVNSYYALLYGSTG